MGLAGNDRIVAGRAPWLFLRTDYAQEFFITSPSFTDQQVNGLWIDIEARAEQVAEHAGYYLVVFVPEKPSIYPEHLPNQFRDSLRIPTRLHQLQGLVERKGGVNVISLHGALARAKLTRQVYHKMDSHWNDSGAYAGYREIIVELTARLPALRLEPVGIEGFDRHQVEMLGDLLGLTGRTRAVKEVAEVWEQNGRFGRIPRFNPSRTVAEVDDPTLPTLVMFHDSFGEALKKFMAPHFRRSRFVVTSSVVMDDTVIAAETPDVVVRLNTERYLAGGWKP